MPGTDLARGSQVNFKGYAGTTGVEEIHGLVVDRVVVPPEYSQYYSEKLVVLPHSYHYNGHDSLYRHLYDGVLSPRIILRLRYAIARDWRWLSGGEPAMAYASRPRAREVHAGCWRRSASICARIEATYSCDAGVYAGCDASDGCQSGVFACIAAVFGCSADMFGGWEGRRVEPLRTGARPISHAPATPSLVLTQRIVLCNCYTVSGTDIASDPPPAWSAVGKASLEKYADTAGVGRGELRTL
eukprot:1416730-Rhodomonas_salina.3